MTNRVWMRQRRRKLRRGGPPPSVGDRFFAALLDQVKQSLGLSYYDLTRQMAPLTYGRGPTAEQLRAAYRTRHPEITEFWRKTEARRAAVMRRIMEQQELALALGFVPGKPTFTYHGRSILHDYPRICVIGDDLDG